MRELLWPPIARARTRLTAVATRRNQLRFVGTQICVTGSCGKSTVARLIGKSLERRGSVLLTGHPNFGKELLRPIRMLRSRVDYAVQEVSAHGPGSMLPVAQALRIDIAVITAVGTDHGARYRHMGMSVPEAIAQEKGTLAAAVPSGGLVCLNADDPLVAAMRSRCRARVVTFGTSEGADFRATRIEAKWPRRLSFVLECAEGRFEVSTRFVGRLMLTNVLAALAALRGTGMPMAEAVAAVGDVEPVKDHLSVHEGDDGKTYILDTFKAPQWSTEMLVEDIRQLGMSQMVFVLGDISDTRGSSGPSYRRVIRQLAQTVEEVVLTANAAYYGRNLSAEGVPNPVIAPTNDDVVRHLATSGRKLVLLKSSKIPRLEAVAAAAGVGYPRTVATDA